MPKLLPLLSYRALADGDFTVHSIEGRECGTHREILLTLRLPEPLPQKISCGHEEFSLTAEEETALLTIRLLEDELKLFSPDNKSCYHRKYALFLPQYKELFSPAFRTNRRGKKSYFELSEEFISSEELRKKYATHLLGILSGSIK